MYEDRRYFLKTGASLVGAAALTACADESVEALDPQTESFPRLYDFSQAEDNLEAFVKVMGDLGGAPVWYTAKGIIYLIREGEMPLPLLGVSGIRYTRFERTRGGFLSYMRDWAVYRDLITDEVLTEFRNPLTGAVNAPRPILTPLVDWKYDVQTGQQLEGFEGEAWLIDRPFSLPWTEEGNDVTVTLELLVKYASGIGGGEWMHLMTARDELNDPGVDATSCRLVWTGHSPVMNWLDRDAIRGRTLWQSNGRKHSTLDSIPDFYRAEIGQVFPGSLENPETYERPEAT